VTASLTHPGGERDDSVAGFLDRMREIGRTPRLLEARGLGVKYDLRLNRAQTLASGAIGLLSLRRRTQDMWALRDVSFNLYRGECLAIIGPNGAGKSTLLQTLSGIITPSEGRFRTRGRVSSLLNLGVGFDPNLSGRENIPLAGAFLRLSPREVRERTEAIIEFADIGQYIDAPIRTYSSGMRARLGFAIASAVDPEILLIDEVLGTGDADFREKSKRHMQGLLEDARAVILVTHDMNWVAEFANYVLVLSHGHLAAEGAPAAAIAFYKATRTGKPYACETCQGIAALEDYCPGCGLMRLPLPAMG
jgi:ABC-type polysaccharide/polyol phosphate transport system ATPase subunit